MAALEMKLTRWESLPRMVNKTPEELTDPAQFSAAEQELRVHLDQLKSHCQQDAALSISSTGHYTPTPKAVLSSFTHSAPTYSPVP